MDVMSTKNKILTFFRKYKYVALVLLVGLVLMVIPTEKKSQTVVAAPQAIQSQKDLSISEQLGNVLSNIQGAGEVRVLLTVAEGEQTLYQTNNTISSGSDTSNTQVSTVTIIDSQRNETGLIRQVNPPVYQGAIVVCQGADSPSVRLSIVDAVSKVTGLGTDRISVLKMK